MKPQEVEIKFSKKQIVGAATALLGLVIILPLGAYAAATKVKIQDADSDKMAQVQSGALKVGDGKGALTVDQGAPLVVDVPMTIAGGTLYDMTEIDIPAGERWVIEHVSLLQTGSVLSELTISMDSPQKQPISSSLDIKNNGGDYLVNDPVLIHAGPGSSLDFYLLAGSTSGATRYFHVSLWGYKRPA